MPKNNSIKVLTFKVKGLYLYYQSHKKEKKMTLTISNQQVSIKAVADFMSRMDSGIDDNGKYESLIADSPEKQAWIQQNFVVFPTPLPSGKTHLNVNLDEAFRVIEG